jgi:seryl-tRNA synthetase
MRILTAIIIKYAPYLIAAALIAGFSGYTVHHWDTGSYNALQAKFSKYQTEVEEAQEASQKAYTKALQDQIDQKADSDRHNAEVISDLSKKTASAQARLNSDAAYIRSLLNGSSPNSSSGSVQVSPPGNKPGAAAPGGESGIEQVADLCAATREEDERNADQLDALIAELLPQLKR